MSWMKRPIVLAVLLVCGVSVLAQTQEIKLATLAPPGTTWFKALIDMGAAWKKDTESRVALTVYPSGGGTGEKAIIQKMRIDSLQASFMTAGGLGEIDDAFKVFNIPFFFETDAEQLAVQKKLGPDLAQRLKAKGYQLVCWGTGGWVQVFSKNKITSLDQLKKSKLYADKDDEKMLQWYKSNGFTVTPLQSLNIGEQLKFGGMIDTAPNPPYLAVMTGIYKDAPYMIDLHIAPLIGALIVTNQAWAKLSPADQAKMMASAQTLEANIRTEAPALDTKSIDSMKLKGLTVVTFDAKAMADLRAEAGKLAATMKGNMVPADIFEKAVAERDAVRNAKGR